MTLHAEAVTSTGAGGTADTFDNVGTVTLRDDATQVLGAWVVAASVQQTAAEAIQGQVRITMQGVGAQIYPGPPYHGGAPATNISATPVLPEFIPFVHNVNGGEDVVVDYSTHLQDPTSANAVVACVVYVAGARAAGPGPPEVRAKWPVMAEIAGGGDTEALGQVLTVAESAIADLIIPNWATEVVGFKQTITPDLFTADEEIIGFVRYRSSIADTDPQEWPLNAFSGPIGTAVGDNPGFPEIPKIATWFPTPGSRATITPNVVLVAAVTTGHSVASSVYFRGNI